VLADLVKVSDILIENFTPRVMRGWGLDYPNLKTINPRIIMVSNTGYGHGGPYSSYPAQATTQEATHGLAAITGYRGDRPSKAGQSYVDFLAWWACTAAALLGLRYRHRYGRGVWADIGMYQLGCFNVSEYILDAIANGAAAPRIGNRHPQFAPQGCYRCAGDDAWCVLSVRNDEEWAALCKVIGRADLTFDQRFAIEEARRARHDEIDDIIGSWSKSVTKLEAMERLQTAGVPSGAVLDVRDLHCNPQQRTRGLFEAVDYPKERNMGRRRVVIGRPWRFEKIPAHVQGPAPTFGQHNHEVLSQILGYDEARCAGLENAGIVASYPVNPRPVLEMDMDERVRLGYLAYWDRDYKKRLGLD
jgi:crotonobetainyl-CoA:carnitine CoA-transferase CaiB-like acyl-CoA transferase